MDDPSLFDEAQRAAEQNAAPLAVRMRPRNLDEVIGQHHLLGPGTPLRRLIEGDANLSLLLWGPPGTGKTTLATLVATTTGRRFVEMSAVTSGVKDVRAAIETAREQLSLYNRQTVLFIDEVHRFSKTQQDALLPGVERGTVSLVGATTENPFFSVISPLLSRSLLLRLEPLSDENIRAVISRALSDDRGFAQAVGLDAEAEAHLIRMSGGDARRALTALEAAAGTATAKGQSTIDLATLEEAVDRAAVRYDRQGDQHYDVISAFIKSMRGSDVDAALHYLARMFEAGEEGRFIARRIMIFASEDVGMADPTALRVAVAAAQAFEMIGFPEAQLNLAQAVIHCALAPKSNAVTAAISAASADVQAGRLGTVPAHLRDSHYAGAAKIDHGRGYRYPHDFPGGVVAQQYAPDEVKDRVYYRPTENGTERSVGERLAAVQAVLKPAPELPAPNDPAPTDIAPTDIAPTDIAPTDIAPTDIAKE